MSEPQTNENAATAAESDNNSKESTPVPNSSEVVTPTSSVTNAPTSKLKAPTNFGATSSVAATPAAAASIATGPGAALATAATPGAGAAAVSKIGRLCTHAPPKAGPPPRDTNSSMSRESDDNLSSINSAYTDMYQETVKRFTRSSLSPEMDRFSPSRNSTKSGSPSQKSDAERRRTSYDFYLEATGRRRSSDQGAVLTVDTEHFIIGQRVWVGGIRSGQIAFIGETHFAPGEWAGIVLDEPNGKNDGCVAGKRYFQCEPKRGIFSRLTRLTMVPLIGAFTPTSPISKLSPERSRTVSPTASIRSSILRSPGKNGLTVGDRVIVSSGFGSRAGILRYLGTTQFALGNWCGIELDEASGKNDGTVDGIRYFECKPKYGVFVPIAKVSLSPSSKKTRLSRTGSRESLASIGTMNSIATTNTSRMRMNAQRKSPSIKPVTTPKSQFSMQDVLREKQSHIEKLMIERDMDREDAQNQALQFQKNINELKSRVTQLERDLLNERKKSDDLQSSVDEATFCGDELNAQTQVYKEKIQDLEQKLTDLASGASSGQGVPVDTSTVGVELAAHAAQLDQQAKIFEARIAELRVEESRLQEHIKYMQTENQTLQKELLEKDESLEKFSLSESGIDNLRRELLLLREENDKERQRASTEFMDKLNERNVEIKRLTDELAAVKNGFATIASERSNIEDECEILRSECKTRDEQLQGLKDQLAQATKELSVQKVESAALEELLKVQQLGRAEGSTQLEEKICEISRLQHEVNELLVTKSALEANLHVAAAELEKLSETQKGFEEKLKEVTSGDAEKASAMEKLEAVLEELKSEVIATSAENESLKAELKNIGESHQNVKSSEETLRKELEEKTKLHLTCVQDLKNTKDAIVQLQTDLLKLQEKSLGDHAAKMQEIESLNLEIGKLQEQTKTLESNSSTAVQQLNMKIKEFDAQKERMQNDLKASEAVLEAQRNEGEKLQRSLAEKVEDLKTSSVALESTNHLLSKLKQEHEHVLTKCREVEDHVKQSEEKCAHQQLELGDMTRKFEALRIKCDSLAVQNETLQQDILVARTAGSEVQATVRQLNVEFAAKQKDFSDMQTNNNAERIKLENQIEELTQKLANAGKDYAELKDTLNRTKEELVKKNELNAALEEKTIKQEFSLSDAVRQQENLQTKYDALATQNDSLQNDLTTLRTTSTDSNAELLKLSQAVAAKQKAYEELLDKSTGERAGLENQIQASQQRLDVLCNQVEALTQELKTTTEESFKRLGELKREQEKSGKQELELGNLTRKLESLTASSEGLESQNADLQKELATLRASTTGANAELLKLTEHLSSKQKALQELTDKTSSERLQFESQLQDLTQRLQASQSAAESLRSELTTTTEAKTVQAGDFEQMKAALQTEAQKTLEEVKAKEAQKQKELQEQYEVQLKNADRTKIALDEAISNMQSEFKMLQDELLKSQLDFKDKEATMGKQIELLCTEKAQLGSTIQEVSTEGSGKLSAVLAEKEQLAQSVQKLKEELQEKQQKLQDANSEMEQLKVAQSHGSADLAKLHSKIESLESALEIANSEMDHKARLAEEDKKKIEEFKAMLQAMQALNANISATNGELSEALEQLEHDNCETSNIFELFEVESEQNMSKLVENLSGIKQQLLETQALVNTKDTALEETQKALENATAKLKDLNQTNEDFKKAINQKEEQILESEGLAYQLNEYRNIVDEMDDASTETTTKLSMLQARIKQLENEKAATLEQQHALQIEFSSLKRKMELVDLERSREIEALQSRINDLQSITKLKQNGGSGDGVNTDTNGDSIAQINFLNSIIADMQKKNDTLKAKIEALEALPTDFTQPHAFDLISKRRPAPRVFCDICDEFDKHETEDCPLQASDEIEVLHPEANNNDAGDKKERKLPEPRKYCESCEVFGHEAGECDDECF